jgi:hypothetical protein
MQRSLAMMRDHDADTGPRSVETLRASLSGSAPDRDTERVDLDRLRIAHENAHTRFQAALASTFPGATEWDWLRACDHAEGEGVARRNDDTSRDGAMATHPALKAAWDTYIAALHEFYAMRDGPKGVLGSRGL